MPPAIPDFPAFTVELTRKDFFYYTWVLALKRPVLPFMIYSFIFLFLIGVTGVWPTARVFSLAVFVPLLGYLLWVWVAAQTLWARHPALKSPRHYDFKPKSYLLGTGAGKVTVAYKDVAQVLSSRRALYVIRRDGSADILPRSALPEGLEPFLSEKLTVEPSSFL